MSRTVVILSPRSRAVAAETIQWGPSGAGVVLVPDGPLPDDLQKVVKAFAAEKLSAPFWGRVSQEGQGLRFERATSVWAADEAEGETAYLAFGQEPVTPPAGPVQRLGGVRNLAKKGDDRRGGDPTRPLPAVGTGEDVPAAEALIPAPPVTGGLPRTLWIVLGMVAAMSAVQLALVVVQGAKAEEESRRDDRVEHNPPANPPPDEPGSAVPTPEASPDVQAEPTPRLQPAGGGGPADLPSDDVHVPPGDVGDAGTAADVTADPEGPAIVGSADITLPPIWPDGGGPGDSAAPACAPECVKECPHDVASGNILSLLQTKVSVQCGRAAAKAPLSLAAPGALVRRMSTTTGAGKKKKVTHTYYGRWDPLESTCRHASLSIL